MREKAPTSTRSSSGYVSVTPLQIDLTNRDQMAGVAGWLDR